MNKKPTSTQKITPSAEQTRRALVEAALRLFAEKGYEGASTREIAQAASANIGSIAYHFGGKDRLYLACADHIVDTMGAIAGDALKGDQPMPPGMPFETLLQAAIERMVAFIVAREEAGEIVQFVLRELQHPTPALDAIYSGVFEPVHKRLCMVWEHVTGEPAESDRTKITVFTLLGQVLYFRIAREAVRRRMGWDAIGQDEADAIAAVAKDNLAAIISARRGGRK
jgi:TetR/AcrR family transcriptional regulator, regulator of cefoperazone and chloramphenicol sensitivity